MFHLRRPASLGLGLLLLAGCPGGMAPTGAPLFSHAPGGTAAPSMPFPQATSAPANDVTQEQQTPKTPEKQASHLYLSYDDSASTAAVELTKYRLTDNQLPDAAWARPWEFFNYESFTTTGAESQGKFQVSMGLWRHGANADTYDLGVHVQAPRMAEASRPNLVLTLVVDVSGSMEGEIPATQDSQGRLNRLDLAKRGLNTLVEHLKSGDVVNLVKFHDTAATTLENFTHTGGFPMPLADAIGNLRTEGGTNLNAGVDEGYRVAMAHYDPNKVNRVLMLTDAYANVGEVDPAKISSKTRINNLEGIYFSGMGVGADFNEAFLNQLTEAGKGAYFSLVTLNDAQRAFSDRLMALLHVAARNVQFRLDFPASLAHTATAAEESSTNQSEVQPTNFSYNTAQFFLESFKAKSETVPGGETFKLTLTYKDPISGEAKEEVYEQSVAEILGQNTTAIQEASLIKLLTDRMKDAIRDQDVESMLNGDLKSLTGSLATTYRGLLTRLLALTP